MRVVPQRIPEVLLIEPRVFGDERGYFLEAWHAPRFAQAGVAVTFAQDSVSLSRRGVLRGLHLQHPHDQGKLVWVLDGEALDVALDVRVGSPTFGQWVAASLSAANHHQLYIPPGFAHGFCVVSETALVAYKSTDVYHPECEIGVAFDDPALGIPWPIGSPVVSPKDRSFTPLSAIDPATLPGFEG